MSRLAYERMRSLGIACFALCLFSFSLSPLTAQEPINWKTLADVEFAYTFVEAENIWLTKADFGEKVKALEGKEIMIKGYLLPVDIEGGMVVLSEFPFSSCFFCGGAGPESVIELRFKKAKQKFKPDEFTTVKGIFRLNTEQFALSYMLENAKRID